MSPTNSPDLQIKSAQQMVLKHSQIWYANGSKGASIREETKVNLNSFEKQVEIDYGRGNRHLKTT